MNGWVKRFSDNTSEVGSDPVVQRREASWSRGRLDDITSVELHDTGHVAILEGFGEFWQSDDYDVNIYQSKPQLITRRIQKKINTYDCFLLLGGLSDYKIYKIVGSKPADMVGFGHIQPLEPYKNQWLTVEMDVQTGKIMFDFKKDRI